MVTAKHIYHRFAFIIPVYNHAADITTVVRQALQFGFPVIVVNDGSTDDTPDRLASIDGITVIHHPCNQGKGAAIRTGFAAALPLADWVLTVDADGQHDPADARRLIASVADGRRALVVGRREGMAERQVPWTSRFGRQFSNFWVFAAGGPWLSDSQSGFRLYPLPECLNLAVVSHRFQFEVEILVRARRSGLPVEEVPVTVTYRPGKARVSHFRPLVDFVRNAAVFSRLILERLFSPLSSKCR